MDPKTVTDVRNVATYLTGLIAVVSCPCHLPILLLLLSGTAAGAYLEANTAMAVTWLLPVFLVSAYATWRLLGGKTNPRRDLSSAADRANKARPPAARAADVRFQSGQEGSANEELRT